MLSKLFPRRPADPKPLPEPDSQLALGALLVRVALSDRTYRQEEIAVIDTVLAQTFDLSPIEAAQLRATCTDLELHAEETDSFAEILRDEVAYAERLSLAHAMWRVVLADGQRHALEEQTLEQIERALALDEADIKAARAAALGEPG